VAAKLRHQPHMPFSEFFSAQVEKAPTHITLGLLGAYVCPALCRHGLPLRWRYPPLRLLVQLREHAPGAAHL